MEPSRWCEVNSSNGNADQGATSQSKYNQSQDQRRQRDRREKEGITFYYESGTNSVVSNTSVNVVKNFARYSTGVRVLKKCCRPHVLMYE